MASGASAQCSPWDVGFQGQLQVSLLRDPSEARLAPEPAAGGHPVHGHAAAVHPSEAEVTWPWAAQDPLYGVAVGVGVWVSLGHIGRHVSQV